MSARVQRLALFVAALATLLVIAACGSEAPPPPPTRTPAPTFTPTVAVEAAPVDAAALATAQAAANQPAVVAPPPASDTGTQPITGTTGTSETAPADPAAAPTVAPTDTPELKAQASMTQQVNVRGGPSTNYAVVGLANPGQVFDITGKNAAGDWWQINYNGQQGWVLGELVTLANTASVAVAQNIPVEPTPAPVVVAPPTNTPEPAPPAEAPPPEPTQAPASNYKFNVAIASRCDRQPAGNWFQGRTYVNGTPQSGFKVVFSGAGPDGEWATPPVVSGPHAGYEGWDQGYFSHIINASNPVAGTWYVWVVDDAGARISEIASWTSEGPGEGCNEAVVDFDSR